MVTHLAYINRPVLFAFAAAVLPTPAVWGDGFELESGGTLQGAAADGTAERTSLKLNLADGGSVTIPRRLIVRTRPISEAEQDYKRVGPKTPDTVDGHLQTARWCRERGLAGQYTDHLRRVIELDPLHDEAHKLLGYQRVDGRWLTRDELMVSRGLVRYDGDYRTRQEVAILERSKRGKRSSADRRSELAQWRRWLTGSDPARAAEAEQAFANLTSPDAANALAQLIGRESDYGVRMLLIDTASRVEHPATVQLFVQLSLGDPDEETRLVCLEHLIKARRPGLSAPYLEALRSNSNEKVNRAAEALGEIGDASATSPLIDALVTTHKFQVGNEGGGDSYSFSPTTGGFQFGGDGPRIEERDYRNARVLSALVRLNGGVNLGYDQAAWRAWLTARAEEDSVDLRRDL